MKIFQKEFAQYDHQAIHAITLVNHHGLEVTCLNYGCIITKIMTPDRNGKLENIVLGFEKFEDYLTHSPYFGAVVGRVAGRIKDGEFELDENLYTLAKNNHNHHLHGGLKGFSDVIWDFEIIDNGECIGVQFTYLSPDGEEGYPGNLEVIVTYTLNNQNEFKISYDGKSDKKTVVNLTNHSYFNLSGNLSRDILNHQLTLKSNQFLELTPDLIPTGTILDVGGTAFDFQNGRKIKDGVAANHPQNKIAGAGYDHPFLLTTNHDKEIMLTDEESGRKLIIETDEKAVVVYTSTQLEGDFEIYGVKARKYLGVCLETQGLPDSIHHPHFPSCVLDKDQEYRTSTTYTFCLV